MTNTCYSQYWDFWYATFAFLMNFHGFIRIIRYYVLCMFFWGAWLSETHRYSTRIVGRKQVVMHEVKKIVGLTVANRLFSRSFFTKDAIFLIH